MTIDVTSADHLYTIMGLVALGFARLVLHEIKQTKNGAKPVPVAQTPCDSCPFVGQDNLATKVSDMRNKISGIERRSQFTEEATKELVRQHSPSGPDQGLDWKIRSSLYDDMAEVKRLSRVIKDEQIKTNVLLEQLLQEVKRNGNSL